MGGGKYKYGNQLLHCRVYKTHIVVRVGGGWDTLENYLKTHYKVAEELGEAVPGGDLAENVGAKLKEGARKTKESKELYKKQLGIETVASKHSMSKVNLNVSWTSDKAPSGPSSRRASAGSAESPEASGAGGGREKRGVHSVSLSPNRSRRAFGASVSKPVVAPGTGSGELLTVAADLVQTRQPEFKEEKTVAEEEEADEKEMVECSEIVPEKVIANNGMAVTESDQMEPAGGEEEVEPSPASAAPESEPEDEIERLRREVAEAEAALQKVERKHSMGVVGHNDPEESPAPQATESTQARLAAPAAEPVQELETAVVEVKAKKPAAKRGLMQATASSRLKAGSKPAPPKTRAEMLAAGRAPGGGSKAKTKTKASGGASTKTNRPLTAAERRKEAAVRVAAVRKAAFEANRPKTATATGAKKTKKSGGAGRTKTTAK